ncbi:unnamed protein product [Larinioides sclopetarius]|uniref:Secreted protein n=1 Tax=Larinioides sclopetarius TaxID=280406 RepID=A0AAV2AT74_9ARAC
MEIAYINFVSFNSYFCHIIDFQLFCFICCLQRRVFRDKVYLNKRNETCFLTNKRMFPGGRNKFPVHCRGVIATLAVQSELSTCRLSLIS